MSERRRVLAGSDYSGERSYSADVVAAAGADGDDHDDAVEYEC